MTIEEFIKKQVQWRTEMYYDEPADERFTLAWAESVLKILEWHEQWPVFVEGPTKFEPDFTDDFQANVNQYTFSMSKQIAFLTQQEYRKKFGDEPPTAPIVRLIAAIWKDHPDYNQEWAL